MTTIKEKEAILNGIEIVKEYVEGHFKTIDYFIDLDGWDVAELFLDDIFVDNLIQAYACLINLIKIEKEEN